MFDALYISATGMQAQQLNVDTIANNLANVNTTGFKKSKVGFTDLMVQEAARLMPGSEEAGVLGPQRRLGAGVGIATMSKLFDMGDLKKTESAFDLAIQGEGFLEVTMPDGSSAYTRGGTFRVNRDGLLATSGGFPLKPNLAIPDNAKDLKIDGDGRVHVQVAGQATPIELGQLEMVRFTSPAGLKAQGDNLYRASTESGEAISAKASEDGMGTIAQGFLEGSNVKLTDEMVNLMVAQRVYEANVKVMQASDEMLGMINALRK
ncbi:MULTISPECIES: flagellar basal-body rod protein FlgG [Variovorax]|jgi:flagellar basal-body rod protein FlgG|uniref:flagellar basal-body rod protein FlgG n=1 Tax=Variovorax TaxID=34072 RepID=UPI00086E7F6F|nr:MULTISPECIES: flagellar basal-body rod protein FlgG [Variovorax]MBN8758314.1 flagellar basal-body rod protein FlgG [Variovorax sp.]ODU12667.1 MAG: flagellar basal-body rod protein FlgG [Variovorax sp. SCN 67-85]ODV19252.1 MAG: flagellar basal-body rod protein FlgG [Variovorax sp. SCN 67-20]OJZ06562.1 MAG: flagellar basal-body rod protein FlgG [Variovorax sp. 67-131]UKI07634.1 flagellar basal-body rod protein FlgG [Variovorax paradoxus]